MNQGLEEICFNCNYFFPATLNEQTEFGVCLQDEAFEPYIDELFEDRKSLFCQDLVEEKKFPGDNSACQQFEEADQGIEIDDEISPWKMLSGLINTGEFSKEAFEKAVLKEQINQIDLKNLPIDKYLKNLNHPDVHKQKKSVDSLGSLVALGNDGAYGALCSYFKNLPAPGLIHEVHFTINVFKYLKASDKKTSLIPIVVDKLYQTPSNNTTKQLINEFFHFFESCHPKVIQEPLEEMLKSKQFSYRLKQKMKLILVGAGSGAN